MTRGTRVDDSQPTLWVLAGDGTVYTWGVAAAVDGDGGNAPEPSVPADQRMPEELLRDWVNGRAVDGPLR